MRFRDRFYTPQTARAILSWRIAVGVGVAAAMIAAGVGVVGSVAAGLAVYGGLVLAAMPRNARRPRIDPFAVGEPWRQYVKGAQRAAAKMRDIVADIDDGPLHDRLQEIAAKIDHGLDETWRIARRGDEIDDAVTHLDPTRLREQQAALAARAADDDSPELARALESVEDQLATTDRLKQRSEQTASSLRLNETRLEELVARAAEVSIGAGDTDAYEHDVEDLVDELEGLRLAIEETGHS